MYHLQSTRYFWICFFCSCLALMSAPLRGEPIIESVTPMTIDNGTGGGAYTTVNWTAQTSAAAFNNDQGFNSTSGNAGTATYTFSGLTPGQQYNVFSTWVQAGQANVSDAVPYSISDGGGVVNVNQRTAGPAQNLIMRETSGTPISDFNFQHLATVTDSGNGTVTVTISTPPTSIGGATQRFALSDGVVLAPVVAGLQVIDNGGSGFSQTGFQTQTGIATAFNNQQAYNTGANSSAIANWTFTNLVPGVYEIFATWIQTGQGNLSAVAPFTISDGGGTDTVNQQVGPAADLIVADTDGGAGVDFFRFERIGQATVVDGQLVVTLNGVTGGSFVMADAVAIRLAEIVPEPRSVLIWGFVAVAVGSVVLLKKRQKSAA